MATMTIRNIDEGLKSRLRIRAAQHGTSMEEEAREILRAALSSAQTTGGDLGAAIRARFAALGGIDLPKVEREPIREPADFAS
jgi:antitoxin FitA